MNLTFTTNVVTRFCFHPVCLSVCQQDYTKTTEGNSMNLGKGWGKCQERTFWILVQIQALNDQGLQSRATNTIRCHFYAFNDFTKLNILNFCVAVFQKHQYFIPNVFRHFTADIRWIFWKHFMSYEGYHQFLSHWDVCCLWPLPLHLLSVLRQAEAGTSFATQLSGPWPSVNCFLSFFLFF